jgi:hypothetical protein
MALVVGQAPLHLAWQCMPSLHVVANYKWVVSGGFANVARHFQVALEPVSESGLVSGSAADSMYG